MIEVEVIDTFDKLLSLEKAWNTALMRSSSNFIFLTFEWIRTWWEHYGQRRRLLVLVVRKEGEISCIAPLMTSLSSRFGLKLRKVEFIGSMRSNWLDFIVPGTPRESLRAAIDHLMKRRNDWDMIDLQNMPLSSETVPTFEEYAQQGRYTLHRELYPNCFYLTIDEEWETYLKSRNRKFRENVRRIDRKMSQYGNVQFVQLDCPEEIMGPFKSIWAMEQKSRKAQDRKTIFGEESSRRFYSDLAQVLGEKGWVILSLLKINGQHIAYDFSFLYDGTFYGYNTAYDKKYSELSPGVYLMRRVLQSLFHSEVKEVDLYRGGAHFKKRWATSTKEQVRLMIFHRCSVYAKVLSVLVPKLKYTTRKFGLLRHHVPHRSRRY